MVRCGLARWVYKKRKAPLRGLLCGCEGVLRLKDTGEEQADEQQAEE